MIYTILGKSGGGKSVLARDIVNKLSGAEKQNKKIVVLDESYDHTKLKNMSVIKLNNSLSKNLNTDKLLNKYDRILINTEEITPEEIKPGKIATRAEIINDFVNRLCRSIWNIGNVIFLIDEAHIFYPEVRPPIELEQKLKMFRKRGIDVILVTQQFRDIRKAAINQCSVLCIGKLFGITEIETAKRYNITKEMILNLQKYEFIFVDAWESLEIEILENKKAL